MVLRHGLPFLLIGGVLLLMPGLVSESSLSIAFPTVDYLMIGLVITIVMFFWSWWLTNEITLVQASWVFYLLGVSLWEEWVFRVAIPDIMTANGATYLSAILISNLLFGAIHYFTLRWKALWCFFAFLGGMGLSLNYAEQGDFLLIVGLHWVATFANTPRPPSGQEQAT